MCRRNAAVERAFPMVPTFGDLEEMVALVKRWSGSGVAAARAAHAQEARRVVLERWTLGAFYERMLGQVG